MHGPTEQLTAQTSVRLPANPTHAGNLARSSFFKYYIHDGADACRLELIGEFTEAELTELNGCWRTARTILGARKLVLDLRGLKYVDDAAKQWLASMGQEGAIYVPESFLRNALADHTSDSKPPRLTFLGKLIATLRGVRVAATD